MLITIMYTVMIKIKCKSMLVSVEVFTLNLQYQRVCVLMCFQSTACLHSFHTFRHDVQHQEHLMLLLYCVTIKSRVECLRQMSIRYYFYRNSPWHVSCLTSCCLFVLGFFTTSQQGDGSFGCSQKPCCQGPLSCSSTQRRDDSQC